MHAARSAGQTWDQGRVEPYKGMIDGLMRCYQVEGVAGLWKGLGPNLMLVSNPTIHFFTYERVRFAFERMAQPKRLSHIIIGVFFMGDWPRPSPRYSHTLFKSLRVSFGMTASQRMARANTPGRWIVFEKSTPQQESLVCTVGSLQSSGRQF